MYRKSFKAMFSAVQLLLKSPRVLLTLLLVWAGVRMMWCAIQNAHRGSAQRIEER